MKTKKDIIELRNYQLDPLFPILALSGEEWRISDIPSQRLHFHNCLEIGQCLSDGGTLRIGSRTLTFQAGDISVVSGDLPHTTYSAPGKSSLWRYLFLDLGTLLAPFNALLPYAQLESGCALLLDRENHPLVSALVSQVFLELAERPAFYQSSVRSLLCSASVALFRLLRTDSGDQAGPAADSRLNSCAHAADAAYPSKCQGQTGSNGNPQKENALAIAPALKCIKYQYGNALSVPDLAAACGLSETHFRRIFTEIMHQSPLECLNQRRIEQACFLLRTTEDSVLSISEQTGFGSLASFNRQFSSGTGTTPRRYRESHSALKRKTIIPYSGWMQPEAP